MAHLQLSLLGSPRLSLDGVPVALDRRKSLALLAYLAAEPGPHPRERLAALLWPEATVERGRANLRRALWTLETALGSAWFDARRNVLGLRATANLELDIREVDARLAACVGHGHLPETVCAACVPLLREAEERFQGAFLAGLHLAETPPFEEWQVQQEAHRHAQHADVLDRLIQWHAAAAAYDQVIVLARRWLARDPAGESAHRALIDAYRRTGRRTAALRQSAACVAALARELAVEPAPETVALIRAVEACEPASRAEARTDAGAATRPAPAPPIAALAPARLSPLIGRQRELAEIRACLTGEGASRLLTITGPGGIGKTRLAQEAVARLRTAFPDGMCMISLAELHAESSLVEAIARALHLLPTPEVDATDQVFGFLRDRRLLLVLDNAEHMLAGTEVLATLLAHAPKVRVLVTSRERLNLRGEALLSLHGLGVPADDDPEVGDAFAAVELFFERARRLRPDLAVDTANARAAVRICRLVDGMPLAIELAAAWIAVLSPAEIADELDRGLDVLRDGPRDTPERHRSLRAVFDHSWRRLSPEEQATMRALSLFRGGFERHAATAVAGADLIRLRGLAEASLLRRREDGRWEMHPVLRHFAAEELDRSGEHTDVAERHVAHFAQWTADRAAGLRGEGQEQALAAMAAEIDNLRAAWQWAVEQRQAELIEAAMEGLFRFYQTRSWLGEAATAFDAALEAVAGCVAPTAALLRARLGVRRAWLAFSLGEMGSAAALLDRAMPVLRDSGARIDAAFALRTLGELARAAGDYGAARASFEESRAVSQTAGDGWGLANAANALGVIEMTLGEYAAAATWFRASVTEYRRTGDQRGLAQALTNLGNIAYLTGSFDEAKAGYEECLAVFERLADQRGVALICNNLGVLASTRLEFAASRRLYERSLAIKRTLGDQPALALALNNLGGVLRQLGENAAAEALLSEARALAEAIEDWATASRACSDLGLIAGGRGARGQAWAEHSAALRYARDSEQAPMMLDALLWAARTLSAENLPMARAAARFVRGHPAAHQALREWSDQLLDETTDADGDTAGDAASPMSVEAMVAAMLERLAQPEDPSPNRAGRTSG